MDARFVHANKSLQDVSITYLLNVGTLVGLGAISVLPFSFPPFLCRHSCFVTARQEVAVGIHDHEQLATRLVAIARVQEVLQGDWALGSADDVDLFSLGPSV